MTFLLVPLLLLVLLVLLLTMTVLTGLLMPHSNLLVHPVDHCDYTVDKLPVTQGSKVNV
jgi:hypothetical protein